MTTKTTIQILKNEIDQLVAQLPDKTVEEKEGIMRQLDRTLNIYNQLRHDPYFNGTNN
ncbi:hypothetical protein M3689_07125 [Alkalihalophilus marmarensis]|jgi:predicted transcriptional regulator|uniref:Uncharacterized protein n=2 Tax=Alkalihalophilus TaxID=2893060 RepID=U6SM59_9BACI|nr:hypothetical protein [Alkalihalophilus marmarensis]ERN52814.1 hypothetical protein A33I_14050 [Alkalihalophilus marmarensis DSM 21297]MCM3489065.1 hypothetical protein [Alkalihalophilus marmarensis]